MPEVRSQIRTVWSRLPVTAIGWPSSWVQATAVTESVWPISGSPIEVLVTRSQIHTVPSTPPVRATARPPKWTQATAVIAPVAVRVARDRFLTRLPVAHRGCHGDWRGYRCVSSDTRPTAFPLSTPPVYSHPAIVWRPLRWEHPCRGRCTPRGAGDLAIGLSTLAGHYFPALGLPPSRCAALTSRRAKGAHP